MTEGASDVRTSTAISAKPPYRTVVPGRASAPARLVRRLRTGLTLKLCLSLALTLYFCVPYFLLQARPVFPVRTLPLSWIDRAVGFAPAWVWAYQSVYLLIAIVPWLTVERAALLRYARGFVLLSSIGFACFFLFPIAGPRPADVPAAGMFAVLVSYDGVLNSLPSLHCGLAAYTVLLAVEVSRGATSPARRTIALVSLAAWCVVVCFATLATKQHYFVDVPPGLLLGWLCHRWAWRTAPAPAGARWAAEVTRA